MSELSKAKETENEVTIELCDRIETKNASEVEAKILELAGTDTSKALILDAQNLNYISSIGLRLMLKLAKIYRSLEIINVSPEVNEIFEMTGIGSVIPVSKRIREISLDGLEVIGEGQMGKAYKLDDETIAKVFSGAVSLDEIQSERDTAQKVFLQGIPTAISFDVIKPETIMELSTSNWIQKPVKTI